jgi:hypothetical protein
MINLIKSEVLKIRSTQVWIWMLVLAVVFTGLVSIATSVDAVDSYHQGSPVDYYQLFTASGQAGFALMVLGILGLTTEFRHKTITPTLLATPNRWQLMGGKVASYVVFSVLYSVVCVVINFAVAITWLSIKNVPLEYGHGVAGGVLKAFVSLVLLGVFGLGVGALIRNQAAAMVFGIVYFTVLSFLLASIPVIRRVYLFEPAGAVAAFTSNGRIDGRFTDIVILSPLVALAVLVAWCVVVVWGGTMLGLKRDIS